MKKWLIVFLVLAAVIAAIAYVNPAAINSISSSFVPTSIGDVLKSPENFVNRNITIAGTYEMTLGGDKFLVDSQDYQMKIDCDEAGRSFELGSQYRARGVVTYSLKCGGQCQERWYYNLTKEEYRNLNLTNCYYNSDSPLLQHPYLVAIQENQTIPSDEESWQSYWIAVPSYCPVNKTVMTWVGPQQIGCFTNATATYIISEIRVAEERCDPNDVAKVYYFKCTSPMEKI